MEQLSIILTLLTALVGYGGLRWVFREGIEKVKNDQNEEELKRVSEAKKISNNISNMDDTELNKRLQKYSREYE